MFGLHTSLDLSHAIYRGNSGVSKNKCTSLWNSAPNSGIGKTSPRHVASVVNSRRLFIIYNVQLCLQRDGCDVQRRASAETCKETGGAKRFVQWRGHGGIVGGVQKVEVGILVASRLTREICIEPRRNFLVGLTPSNTLRDELALSSG